MRSPSSVTLVSLGCPSSTRNLVFRSAQGKQLALLDVQSMNLDSCRSCHASDFLDPEFLRSFLLRSLSAEPSSWTRSGAAPSMRKPRISSPTRVAFSPGGALDNGNLQLDCCSREPCSRTELTSANFMSLSIVRRHINNSRLCDGLVCLGHP